MMGGTNKEEIKIIVNNGRAYFFAVENQEEVYNEILNKINQADVDSE